MRKITGIIAMIIFLTSCGAPSATVGGSGTLRIAASSYPVYNFAREVIHGAENVSLSLVVDEQIGCLHDYTLKVSDMEKLEAVDILAENGAGLEDFLSGVIARYPDLFIIDSSANISELIVKDGEPDPHVWMSPRLAAAQVREIGDALRALDPDNADIYARNAEAYAGKLEERSLLYSELLSGIGSNKIITFHDGFGYLAREYNLSILTSIEEEPGAEASAGDIAEVISLIRGNGVGAVFVEKYGSRDTADAISRETGAAVYSLDMALSGPADSDGYLDAMDENVNTLKEALK